jgi:multidrug efflux pump subunit AcrA (membrane-fusion protein)
MGGGAGRGGDPADQSDRQARMMDRFKKMSPDEQKQFIARMKDRGQDTTVFEKASVPQAAPPKAAAAGLQTKYGAVASGETIDALFAPLAPVESQGRAWVYADKQLKPVRLRLGITDGTNTELLSGELQPGMELVTGVMMSGARTTNTTGGGNPLIPQRGGGPGGFGGGRGR